MRPADKPSAGMRLMRHIMGKNETRPVALYSGDDAVTALLTYFHASGSTEVCIARALRGHVHHVSPDACRPLDPITNFCQGIWGCPAVPVLELAAYMSLNIAFCIRFRAAIPSYRFISSRQDKSKRLRSSSPSPSVKLRGESVIPQEIQVVITSKFRQSFFGLAWAAHMICFGLR